MQKLPVPQSFSLTDVDISPEERLLHGIVWRALKDLVCAEPKDRRSALTYLLSDDTEDDEWSFKWVCIEINLDPTSLIKHLKKYQYNLLDSLLLQKIMVTKVTPLITPLLFVA